MLVTKSFDSSSPSFLDITPALEEYLQFVVSCTLNSIITVKAMLLACLYSSADCILIVSPFKYVAVIGNRHYRLERDFLLLNNPSLLV